MKCAIHPERDAVATCQHTHEEVVVTTTEKGKKIYEKKQVSDCDLGMCEECAALNAKICPTSEKTDLETSFNGVNARFKFALLGLILTAVITLAVVIVWLFARDDFYVVGGTFAGVTAISFVVTQELLSRQFKKAFNMYWIALFSLIGLALTPFLLIYFIVIFIVFLTKRQQAKQALTTYVTKYNALTNPPAPPTPEQPVVDAPATPEAPKKEAEIKDEAK